MNIEINNLEYKNNQYEVAVLLTHPKKETILILSKNLLDSATYLEYNDRLKQLMKISIIDCPEFSDIHKEFSMLPSLRKIYFENVPALKYLPTEVQHLTGIEEVYLSEYENIKNVPDHWINIMDK